MQPKETHSEITYLLRQLQRRDLSREEWARLHNAAEHDPFLTDAIEGLQSMDPTARSTHLRSLHDRLLPQEVKPARRILLPRWAAAATVLVLVGGSLYIWTLQPRSNFEQAAATESLDDFTATKEIVAPAPQADEISIDDAGFASDQPADKPVADPADGALPQPKSKLLSDARIASSQELTSAIQEEEPQDQTAMDANEPKETLEQPAAAPPGTPAGYQADRRDERLAESAAGQARPSTDNEAPGPADSAAVATMKQQITGIIQDDSGAPLIGANVLLKGTSNQALTDMAGNFSIDLPERPSGDRTRSTLVVSYTGYQTRETLANPGDSLLIQLEQGAVLNEVTTTGLSAKRSGRQTSRALAQPVGGEQRYERYLRQNVRIPEEATAAGIHGEVVLEFTIRPNGRPDEIRIIQSLGFGCDEEAIRLVDEGPDWDVAGAQVPIARVTVKF